MNLRNIPNLQETILKEKQLSSEASIASNLIPKMEIYGFIPYCSFESMEAILTSCSAHKHKLKGVSVCDIDKNEYKIYSDRIKSYDIIIPFYKHLSYILDESQYDTDMVYVPTDVEIIDGITSKLNGNNRYTKKSYIYTIKKSPLRDLYFIDETDNETVYRVFKKSHYIFKNEFIKAASEDFLVLCRYINAITGRVDYAVYEPTELYPSI